MPLSIRATTSPQPTSPRGLKYVPTHLIPQTLKMIKDLNVDEIPSGVMLASICEFATSLIAKLEGQGKVVEFTYKKLEKGKWDLAWAIKERPSQAKKR